MSDNLLLAGVVLCVLSMPVAIATLLASRPPRGAALLLVAGVLLLFGAAYLAEDPIGLHSFGQAWERVFGSGTAG